jgi:hypothetical protein
MTAASSLVMGYWIEIVTGSSDIIPRFLAVITPKKPITTFTSTNEPATTHRAKHPD